MDALILEKKGELSLRDFPEIDRQEAVLGYDLLGSPGLCIIPDSLSPTC